MTKIVIIGAGSKFGGRLSIDIMSREVLQDAQICLCDPHSERLAKVKDYVKRTVSAHGLPTQVAAGTDRTEFLPGASFVVTSISVGGGAYYGHPYKAEVEIPQKYGLQQSVADTCSTGAVFRFLRTGPVQNQILNDVERLCPDALVLNHTNPMSMLTWLHNVSTNVNFIGLCHGVQNSANTVAELLDIPFEELSYKVAGINHLAWYLEFLRNGESIYPQLFGLLDDPEKYKKEAVRLTIMKEFGYFPTEGSGHDSEYMPYFRRTPELLEKYGLRKRRVREKSGKDRAWFKDKDADDNRGGEVLRRSREYTTGIMEAMLTDVPFRFNGNVMNTGLISNLPEGCCVEVPCMADARGIHPCYVGDLPPQLAALNRNNINVHELAVRAVLDRDRDAAFHACALDPLTSSVVSLDDLHKMFDELWEAERDLLQWFEPGRRGRLPEPFAAQ